MKDYLMNQCKFKKGNFYTTTWIPKKFAIKGKFVKIKMIRNYSEIVWEDGWEIIAVYQPSRLSKHIIERSEDYKNTRKASDI